MNERFIVGSVTGYPETGTRLAKVWYVWDKAYCYEIVAEFRSTWHGEEQARELAERLNHPGVPEVLVAGQ
jgi:hypothetical protein